jgi:hypothetical protein
MEELKASKSLTNSGDAALVLLFLIRNGNHRPGRKLMTVRIRRIPKTLLLHQRLRSRLLRRKDLRATFENCPLSLTRSKNPMRVHSASHALHLRILIKKDLNNDHSHKPATLSTFLTFHVPLIPRLSLACRRSHSNLQIVLEVCQLVVQMEECIP